MKKLKYGSRALCLLLSLCFLLTSCGKADRKSDVEQFETEIMEESIGETVAPSERPTSVSKTVSEQEQEEVPDNTQTNKEIFFQLAEDRYGLSFEQAQSWFDIVMEDDIFDGGVREISELLYDDIDGNGETDMVIRVQETKEKYMYEYGTGALYFYMNGEEPYCFEDENFPFFGDMTYCYADLNGDGSVQIAFAMQGSGAGATGDIYVAVLSYKDGKMERLELPTDLDDDRYVGIKVDVTMESETDTYTAYCPYLDESITFQSSNALEEYLERAPLEVGGECRGYCGLAVVEWEGRNALLATEYLFGEGGIIHCVGWASFILVWDEQGNGSVVDWRVQGASY